MYFKLSINGTKHEIDIPTFWSGVSVRQFQALAQGTNMWQSLAVFTSIDADTWRDYFAQASITESRPLVNALNFLNHPPNLDKIPIPPEVLLLNRVVKPLKKLENLKSHAFHNIVGISSGKEPNELIDILHELAGHGLCQSWTRGKYDEGTAGRLAENLLDEPITTVYPIAHFFFFAAQLSAANGQPSLMRRRMRKARRKARRRALMRWISSGRLTWSTH